MTTLKTPKNQQIEQLSRMVHQMSLHIGIYQSVLGDLPEQVVRDVLGNLNKTAVFKDPAEFITHVRDVAARMADKAKQAAADAEKSHSPYSVQPAEQGTQQSLLNTLDTLPKAPLVSVSLFPSKS